MNSALEYMASLHPTLANNYRTPDGRYIEHCGLIAADIAERLLAEGKKPAIFCIKGEPIKEEGCEGNKTLVPQQYKGRVTWGAHQFCTDGEKVYDPILKEPVSIKDYVPRVFGEGNYLIKVLVSSEKIKEFVGR